jgi:hypothetical protein
VRLKNLGRNIKLMKSSCYGHAYKLEEKGVSEDMEKRTFTTIMHML